MAGGLAALLDDVATIAKMASSASTKAVGVVVDDTAVTPRFVQGVHPSRELPIIGKIALGSLVNKLVIILPLILLLSQFAPWALPPLLMVGGTYLCFEGAEKIWEAVAGHHETPTGEVDHVADAPAVEQGPEVEKKLVWGAVTTDFILSTEIMVISLDSLTGQANLLDRAIALIIVALVITALVYGVVALIVKMDDVGLKLAESPNAGARSLGNGLVKAMPIVMSTLSTVGIAAMLWVGGHIVIAQLHKVGVPQPEELLHHLVEPAAHIHGFLGWLVETLGSAAFGLVLGAIVVAILHVLPLKKKGHGEAHA